MDNLADTNLALLTLQTIHTVVYAAGQASVLMMLWCGVTGRQHPWLRPAIGCLTMIIVARAFNGGACPLYTMALWLVEAAPGEPVRDMLTPIWFNELVTPVNMPLGAAGMALVAWRAMTGRWVYVIAAPQELEKPFR